VAQKLATTEGLIYLAGSPTTLLEDSDQDAPFRQRRYFFYLSGYAQSMGDDNEGADISSDVMKQTVISSTTF
jgi:hypothetical protein